MTKQLEAELKSFKMKYMQKQQQMKILKSQFKKCVNQLNQLRHFVETMRTNGDTMWQMSQFNENMRRRCQHELNKKLSELDCQNNKIFMMEQNRQLYMMKYEVLEEQFTLLFNSIETISNAKNLEDKYDLKIESLENQIHEQSSENKMLETYVRETTADRDNYRKHTN